MQVMRLGLGFRSPRLASIVRWLCPFCTVVIRVTIIFFLIVVNIMHVDHLSMVGCSSCCSCCCWLRLRFQGIGDRVTTFQSWWLGKQSRMLLGAVMVLFRYLILHAQHSGGGAVAATAVSFLVSMSGIFQGRMIIPSLGIGLAR